MPAPCPRQRGNKPVPKPVHCRLLMQAGICHAAGETLPCVSFRPGALILVVRLAER